MRRFDVTPNWFRVADFISWQREGTLDLRPPFQRLSVWKSGAKSFLIDTVVRGLPVPLIFIRERINLEKQKVVREIVDGQQRLRAIFAYVDRHLLPDYRESADEFVVRPEHNPELAGKPFGALSKDDKNNILSYRFSVYTLSPDVENRDVLQMFARLNATGVRLNDQELRNAQWFGEFKTAMYALAYEQLERWQRWNVFTDDKLSRMQEVEFVSDLVINMRQGLAGKSQRLLGRYYQKYDDSFSEKVEVSRRFRRVMDAIDETYGEQVGRGVFHRLMHFFTLFVHLYDRMYGLGGTMNRRTAEALPAGLADRIAIADQRLATHDVPHKVAQALTGAATDIGRRRTRLEFLADVCNG